MKTLKFRKQTIILSLVLILSLLAAACASPATTTPAVSSPPSTTAKPAVTSPAVSSPAASPSAPAVATASPSATPSASPSGAPSPNPSATAPASPPASISPGASPAPTSAGFTLNVSTKTGIGNYLVDARGMTLYYFAKDVNGKSNATGAVLQTWPVFNAAAVSVPSSLAASDFSPITRSDAVLQTAYKGWPLYYFANDKAPGDTNGEGVAGVWFLVKVPFYTVMLQNRTDFGNYLADPKGMTLYYNNKDSAGTSTVSGAILANWPIFNAASFILPSTLNASDFGTITRTDGQKQSTYKGFPLYYYVNDKASGDALGNGLGGVWFVISTANFPPSPIPTPQQPSGY